MQPPDSFAQLGCKGFENQKVLYVSQCCVEGEQGHEQHVMNFRSSAAQVQGP